MTQIAIALTPIIPLTVALSLKLDSDFNDGASAISI